MGIAFYSDACRVSTLRTAGHALLAVVFLFHLLDIIYVAEAQAVWMTSQFALEVKSNAASPGRNELVLRIREVCALPCHGLSDAAPLVVEDAGTAVIESVAQTFADVAANATHRERVHTATAVVFPNARVRGVAAFALCVDNGACERACTPDIGFVPSLDGNIRQHVFAAANQHTAIKPAMAPLRLFGHRILPAAAARNDTLAWALTVAIGHDVPATGSLPDPAHNCTVETEATETIVRTVVVRGVTAGVDVGTAVAAKVGAGNMTVQTDHYDISFDLATLLATPNERLLPTNARLDLFVHNEQDTELQLQATVPLQLLCVPNLQIPAEATFAYFPSEGVFLELRIPFAKARPFASAAALPGSINQTVFLRAGPREFVPDAHAFDEGSAAMRFHWTDTRALFCIAEAPSVVLVYRQQFYNERVTSISADTTEVPLDRAQFASRAVLSCNTRRANAWDRVAIGCIVAFPGVTTGNITRWLAVAATERPLPDPAFGSPPCAINATAHALENVTLHTVGGATSTAAFTANVVGNVRFYGAVEVSACVNGTCARTNVTASLPFDDLALLNNTLLASTTHSDLALGEAVSFHWADAHRMTNTTAFPAAAVFASASGGNMTMACNHSAVRPNVVECRWLHNNATSVVTPEGVYLYRQPWTLSDGSVYRVCAGTRLFHENITLALAVVDEVGLSRRGVTWDAASQMYLQTIGDVADDIAGAFEDLTKDSKTPAAIVQFSMITASSVMGAVLIGMVAIAVMTSGFGILAPPPP